MSISLFFGDESYLIDQRKREFVTNNNDVGEVHQFDGFCDSCFLLCNMLPFMVSKTVIVIKGSFKDIINENFDGYVCNPLESTELFIHITSGVDKRTKKFKGLKGLPVQLTEVKKLNSREFTTFVEQKLSSLDYNAGLLSLIVELLSYDDDEENLYSVTSKLDILNCYNGTITRSVIEEVLAKEEKAAAFELLDAILSGKNQRAFELIDAEERNGTSMRTLGLFISNASLMLRVAIGASYKELGISDWRYKKIKKSLSSYKTSDVRDILNNAISIKKSFLSGDLKQRQILFELVTVQ